MSLGKALRRALSPVTRALAAGGVHPSVITVVGCVAGVAATVPFAFGATRLGGVLLILAGILDTLDGEVARLAKRESKFGALLDSTCDRITEIALFAAVAVHDPSFYTLLITFLCALLAFLVPYTRARGEGLGVSVRVGPADRATRLTWLSVTAIVGGSVFLYGLAPLAILMIITVARRMKRLHTSLRT